MKCFYSRRHERIVNQPAAQSGNETETALNAKRIQKALESAQKPRATFDGYLNTISANDSNIPRLETTLQEYMSLSRKVDEQIMDIENDRR